MWAAVIGDPVSHSLSPALHRTAFRLLGLDWEYRKYRVRPDDVASFIRDIRIRRDDDVCVGLSVTAPLKRAVLPLTDAVDGLAKLVGAANTLVFSASLDAAFNTDVQGIVETVRPAIEAHRRDGPAGLFLLTEASRGPLTGQPAPVVIGTGATACSALAAIKSLGATSVILVGRNFSGPRNAFAVANALGLDTHTALWKVIQRARSSMGQAPLVISTVPPAVTAEMAGLLVPNPASTLLDVTYSAGQTPLEQAFERAGASVASPLTMLTHQGIAQVKLWTSQEVPFDPVHKAVLTAAHTG